MSENPASDPEIQTLFGGDKVEIHHSAAPVGEVADIGLVPRDGR